MLNNLKNLFATLKQAGKLNEAQNIEDMMVSLAEEKWMQKATNPKEKGELHRKLNIPEDQEIPTEKLEAAKRRIQNKSKGDKKLSESDRELLSQIQFALNARRK